VKSRVHSNIIIICSLYLTIAASTVSLAVQTKVGTHLDTLCEAVLLFEVMGNEGAAEVLSHAVPRLIDACRVFAGTHGESGTNPGDRYALSIACGLL
jgi:hypothetical protein